MIRVGNEYGIHAVQRQMRIVVFTMNNADVVLVSLECPEPQKHKRQPANVLCENPSLWADRRRKFERESIPNRTPDRQPRFRASNPVPG